MLVREHQASLYRYLRYLGAAGAGEDLTQETFLAAFKSPLPPDMTNVPLRLAWLRGISRNLLLAHFRRRRNNPRHIDNEYLLQAENAWAWRFRESDSESKYAEALRKCVADLSDNDRHMLELRYAGGKSRAEMARLGQMSEDGVKSLMRRVRDRLGQCVRRRLRAGGDQ